MIKKYILLGALFMHTAGPKLEAFTAQQYAAGGTIAALAAALTAGTTWRLKRKARLRKINRLRRAIFARALRRGDTAPDARSITLSPGALERMAPYILALALAAAGVGGVSTALLHKKTQEPDRPLAPQYVPPHAPPHQPYVPVLAPPGEGGALQPVLTDILFAPPLPQDLTDIQQGEAYSLPDGRVVTAQLVGDHLMFVTVGSDDLLSAQQVGLAVAPAVVPGAPVAPVVEDSLPVGSQTSRFDDLRPLPAGSLITLKVDGEFVGEFIIGENGALAWQTVAPQGWDGSALTTLNALNNRFLFNQNGQAREWRATYHGDHTVLESDVPAVNNDVSTTIRLAQLPAGAVLTLQEGGNRIGTVTIFDMPADGGSGRMVYKKSGDDMVAELNSEHALINWRNSGQDRYLVYQGTEDDESLRITLPANGSQLDGTARYYELLSQGDRLRIVDTSSDAPVIHNVIVGASAGSWARYLSMPLEFAGQKVTTTQQLYNVLFPAGGLPATDGRLMFAGAGADERRALPGFAVYYNPAPLPAEAISAGNDDRLLFLKEGQGVSLVSRINGQETAAIVRFIDGLPAFTVGGQQYNIDQALASFVIAASADALLSATVADVDSPMFLTHRAATLKQFQRGVHVALADGTEVYYVPHRAGSFECRHGRLTADKVLFNNDGTVVNTLNNIGRGYSGSPSQWGPANKATVTFLTNDEVDALPFM